MLSLLLTALITYILPSTTLTLVVHQQPIFVTHLAVNMVHNAFDLFNKFTHHSLPKPHTKLSTTQPLMTTTSLNKTRITPLMAQPFEVINVTAGSTGSTQDVTKPPDQPDG